MSDEIETTEDGEQFSRMIARSVEQIAKKGLQVTKDVFKQTSKKVLTQNIPKFSDISPRSNRKREKHLQDSFSYAYDDEKQEASIKSTKTGNLVNWLDHGHIYHTKKGDKFWAGKQKGKYTQLKKETDNALIREFETAFEKS